ncbi:MAG: SEC-C metal-binding domain-containing protein, partial [Clostridiales bacterium]
EDHNKEGNFEELVAKHQLVTEAEKQRVIDAGGLFVIGTERHESRRIDNQLRGRSGRQGDPGQSRFFLSMEDDLVRVFGGDNMGSMMDKLGVDDSMPIDSSLVTKSIENAQKKVENNNFDTRKHVLDYDDVMNQQREVIYGQRRQVLTGENIKEQVLGILDSVVDASIATAAVDGAQPDAWDLEAFITDIRDYLPHSNLTVEELGNMDKDEIEERLHHDATAFYAQREEELGADNMDNISRYVLLRVVDRQWMDHLDAMDQLRTGIGLQAYGQKNPLVEYKYAAFDMFQQMIAEIQRETIRLISRANVVEEQPSVTVKNIQENRSEDGEVKVKKPVRKEHTVGRNDPCPCGSGKKYKKCCGKNQE